MKSQIFCIHRLPSVCLRLNSRIPTDKYVLFFLHLNCSCEPLTKTLENITFLASSSVPVDKDSNTMGYSNRIIILVSNKTEDIFIQKNGIRAFLILYMFELLHFLSAYYFTKNNNDKNEYNSN